MRKAHSPPKRAAEKMLKSSLPHSTDTDRKKRETGMVTPVARPSMPSVRLTAFTVPTMTKAAKTV